MRFKKGVVLYELDLAFKAALPRIDDVYLRLFGRDAVMTSCREGKHSVGSRHYLGKAADFRTRNILRPNMKRALRDTLAIELGPGFDVVLEHTHLHVELDP